MEIKGNNPNINPLGPESGPPAASGPDKTKGASFNESMSAGEAAPTGGAAPTGATGGAAGAAPASTDPLLNKLQSRIQEGVKAGEPKQQILESLISEQLQTEFGGKATPQMTAAVAERFQSDPQLSQVFNRLYAMATK